MSSELPRFAAPETLAIAPAEAAAAAPVAVDWLAIAALATVVVLFVGLFVLRRRRLVRFGGRTLIALAAGIGVGLGFRGHLDLVAPIGDLYVQLVIAIVAPLIVVSILSSVTSLGGTASVRTIGVRSAAWLLGLNLIAILLTLGIALSVGLGKGAAIEIDGVDGSTLSGLLRPLDQVLLGLFPSNIAADVTSNNIVGLVLFALLLAVSYLLVARREAEKVRPFKDFIDAAKLVMYRAVGFVIGLTPYAVLALVAVTTATAVTRVETVLALVGVLVVSVVVAFLDAYVVNGILLALVARVSPVRFFRKLTAAQYTAFTTQSSVGTLPLTISALTRRVGVPESIANFTAPIGTTIGMPGCAGIWPIVVAVFSINALGIDYGPLDYLALIVLCLLVSLGTAGVPGTAIITATAVLTAVSLPVEVLVLLIPISAIAGTASTMANVTAAATAATIVARQEGTLDDAVFDADGPVEPSAPEARRADDPARATADDAGAALASVGAGDAPADDPVPTTGGRP